MNPDHDPANTTPAALPTGWWHCPHCGEECSPTADAEYCTSCGESTEPHTETDLAAWARATAPTLTDAEWRDDVPACAESHWDSNRVAEQRFSCSQARALQRELDRIAGELESDEWDALRWSRSRHPRWLHDARKRCHAKGLFAFDDSPKRTPLGRAVLARKAAQP